MPRARLLVPCLLLTLSLVTGAAVSAPRAADPAALDAYIANARVEWGVPGMSVAIVKDGEVVLSKGYGVRHVEEGGPVDENTLFAIASNSKAFTAASLAILVDEGKIDWDDRVVDHLPYFRLYDPYVTQEMRIRDLLCHRSGLGTFSGDLLWYASGYTAEEVVRRARYLPPAGPFRARYGYSNLMFIAAGEVVPAVTGQRWTEFVDERIFDVLGMERTTARVGDLDGMDNVATPHAEPEGELVAYPWRSWEAASAAASIASSASEMAKWIRLQLGRGEVDGLRVFSAAASEQMWSTQIALPVSASSRDRYPSTHFRGYGLGWSLMDYLGRKVVSHGGAYDGMFSRVALVPEESLGMVILTNSTTSIGSTLMYRILDAYLGGEERDWAAEGLDSERAGKRRFVERQEAILEGRVEGTERSVPLGDYAGRYGGAMYGDAIVTVATDDDDVTAAADLVLRLLPNAEYVADLVHLHHDTFLLEWRNDFPWFGRGTAQFVLDAAGRVVEMKIDVPNDDFWFSELEFRRR